MSNLHDLNTCMCDTCIVERTRTNVLARQERERQEQLDKEKATVARFRSVEPQIRRAIQRGDRKVKIKRVD